jgi:tetratricopeptide (TPR) repeat protein
MAIEPRIFGRESELETLLDHMGTSLSGQGRLVLVAGEVGSGKSALCEEFERMATISDCNIIIGRCVPGSQSPYLPFMEAFHDQRPNPFLVEDDTSNVKMGAFLLYTLECIEVLSKKRPLLLRLEDLHWADSATISLIHFLARNIGSIRVMIIGTYRPEDIHAANTGEMHPLMESLRVMRREGVVNELELKLLRSNETRKIVRSRLGGEVDDALSDFVIQESRGNPLFAVEMTKYLVESGQAVQEAGIWKLHRHKQAQIPSTIREVVIARTSKLSKQRQRVMDCASVIGEAFDPKMIELILGLKRSLLLEDLEALSKEHHLIIENGDLYRFSHEKIRQVTYDQISLQRRRELHRVTGIAMETRLPNDELLTSLSYHFDKADENEKCVIYSVAAGKYCLRRGARKEAKDCFKLVKQRADGEERFLSQRLEALEGLGDLSFDVSTASEWYSYYEDFLNLNKDNRARARVLTKAAECWDQMSMGDTIKANQLLDEAESLSCGDPVVLAAIEYRRAELDANDGNPKGALDHLLSAKLRYSEVNDESSILRCQILEVYCLHQQYRVSEAGVIENELLNKALGSKNPELLLEVEELVACIRARIGEIEQAERHASDVIELAGKLGMMWQWRQALRFRAWAEELEGEIGSARADVLKGLENAKECEVPYQTTCFEIDLGIYEAELGLMESAEQRFAEASTMAPNYTARLRCNVDVGLAMLEADLRWREGSVQESEEVYERTIRWLVRIGKLGDLVNCHCRYALSLAARGMIERAKSQFEEAMTVAKRIGTSKRVSAFARRVGIAI